MRITSVVGARPQFVKLAPIAEAFQKAGIDHRIIHTGQHYDANMSDVFFADLKIPEPDVDLGVGSGTHGEQTGAMLAALDKEFSENSTDWVLVYGDTNSTLAATLAAVKLHIPVAHLEAGLRSFNRRMPEEHNRVLTDHAADILLAPTEVAAKHLANEGLSARTIVVGDVMTDICLRIRDQVSKNGWTTPGVEPGTEFRVATIHRVDNTDRPEQLRNIVNALASSAQPVVLMVHPRLAARANEFDIDLAAGSITPIDPLPYPEMVAAVVSSTGVITDSGGLQKEAYLLATPCTTVRAETEWVETLNNGWNSLVTDPSLINEVANRPVPTGQRRDYYGDGKAAEKVADALSSR